MSIKKIAALLLSGALCLSAFTACGANPEDAVATLGEEQVSFGAANFLVKYQKASVDDMYTAYGITWDTDLYQTGSTMEDDFKASAMELLHDMYTLKNHMADYGIEITSEDEAAIKEAATAFLAANSEAAIKEMGATQEIVEEVLTLYTIQAKMYNAIIEDTDRQVDPAEANMRGYSLVTINIDGEYDESYNYVEYTDAEVAVLRETAKQMSEKLLGKTLEAAAEEFDLEVTTGTYAKDNETLAKELKTALDGLKEGHVSSIIETDTAIYFARIDTDKDEVATAGHKAEIIAEREAALYEKVLAGWQENDGWEVNDSVVDKIDFHHVFTQVEESTEEVENTEGK